MLLHSLLFPWSNVATISAKIHVWIVLRKSYKINITSLGFLSCIVVSWLTSNIDIMRYVYFIVIPEILLLSPQNLIDIFETHICVKNIWNISSHTMYFLSRITHHVFITLDVHDVVVFILKWLIGILFNLALQEIKPKAVVFISIHSRENNAAKATFYGCFMNIWAGIYFK